MNKPVLWTFLFIALLGCIFSLSPWQLKLEQISGLHWLFQSRGPISQPKDIVIVALNNKVSEQLNYPAQVVRWSRAAHAELINELSKRGAALMVIDIAFKEARTEEDQILADAIERAGNVILFKYLKRHQRLSSLNDGGVLDIEQQLLPPKLLLDKALGAASFTLTKSPNSIVSAPVYVDLGNGAEGTKPLMAFLEYNRKALKQLLDAASLDDNARGNKPLGTKRLHQQALALRFALGKDISLADKLQKTVIDKTADALLRETLAKVLRVLQREESLYVNFYGPSSTLKVIPMDAFFSSGEQLPDIKNKIVFIGASETRQTEQQDVHQTVFRLDNGIDLSGVEISATVLANLMYGNDIKPLSVAARILTALAFAILGFAAFLRFPVLPALALQGLVVFLYTITAMLAFRHQQLWFPLLTPLIILAISNVSALYTKYAVSKKRHQHVLHALAHYLPLNIAEQLSTNVSELEKQQKLVQGICLMTDIQGYTQVSETLSPKALHQQLNRYYETLIDAVNKHQGSVANIVGDSLLAIWTAPVLDEKLCTQAFAAACEIAEKNNSLSSESIKLPTSIALHGGEFSLGNLGARNHFEYAPVGDIVNTTSRIEHINRDLGTKLLCSGKINSLLPKAHTRYLGKFMLRNKAESVSLYEYLDNQCPDNDSLNSAKNNIVFDAKHLSSDAEEGGSNVLSPQELIERNRLFSMALTAFENNDWVLAQTLFETYLNKYPDDGPAIYYVKQCRYKLTLKQEDLAKTDI